MSDDNATPASPTPHTPPTSFVIDRSKWARGVRGCKTNVLLGDDEMMCCMGQVAKQCGFADRHLLGVGSINNLVSLVGLSPRLPEALRPDPWDKAVVGNAYMVNDCGWMHDDERERLLTASFAEVGITLTFVDHVEPKDVPGV